jgi:hypothetical protein
VSQSTAQHITMFGYLLMHSTTTSGAISKLKE